MAAMTFIHGAIEQAVGADRQSATILKIRYAGGRSTVASGSPARHNAYQVQRLGRTRN